MTIAYHHRVSYESSFGYVLIYIFQTQRSEVVLGILGIMLITAGWISLRTVAELQTRLFTHALLCITSGEGFTLIIIT